MAELREVYLIELVDLSTSENDPVPNLIELTIQDNDRDEECQISYEIVDLEAMAELNDVQRTSVLLSYGSEDECVEVEGVDDVGERDDPDDETVYGIITADEDSVQAVDELLGAVAEVNSFEEVGLESFEEALNAGALCQRIETDGARHAVATVQEEAEEIPKWDKTTESAGISSSQRLADFKNEEFEPTGSEQWREDETGNEHHGEPYRCEDVRQLEEEGRSSSLLEDSGQDPINEPSSSASSATSRNSSTWDSKSTWDSSEGVTDFTTRFHLAYNYVVMNSQAEMQNQQNSNRSSFIDVLKRSPRISRKISGVVNSTTGATKRNPGPTVESQDSEYSDSE